MSELPARVGQIRLRDLLLLEKIETHRTLAGVAQELHLTQPAITFALQGLERAFGATMVERGRRGVALTGAGRAALSHLRAVGQDVSTAVRAATAPERAHFRIGSSPMAALDVLPRAIARFRGAQPNIDLTLSELPVPALWQQLGEGQLDAIVSRLPAERTDSAETAALRWAIVGSELLVLVAGKAHPAARRKPALEVLARHEWVLPPRNTLAYQVFEQWFVRSGIAVPRVVVTATSFLTNMRLAASCGLLTVAPESAARSQGPSLGLKVMDTPWEHRRGDIAVVWRNALSDHPLLAAFLASFDAIPATATAAGGKPGRARHTPRRAAVSSV